MLNNFISNKTFPSKEKDKTSLLNYIYNCNFYITHRFCPQESINSPVSLKTSIVGWAIGGSPMPWYTFLSENVLRSHTLVARWKARRCPDGSRATPATWPIFTEVSGQFGVHWGAIIYFYNVKNLNNIFFIEIDI